MGKLLHTPYIRVLPRTSDSQNILFHYSVDPQKKGDESRDNSFILENSVTLYVRLPIFHQFFDQFILNFSSFFSSFHLDFTSLLRLRWDRSWPLTW